ncbi:MAG: MtN3 and saliva related transmembrane protein [Lentimonas sp.]|jgi:MtN3 and saliva related transmembrane protein
MEANLILIFNVLGACLTTLSFIPQAIKTIKTRETSGISLLMYFMFVLGVLFWGIFGALIHNWPMIIANGITFLLAGTVLFIKVSNSLFGLEKENFILGKFFKRKN